MYDVHNWWCQDDNMKTNNHQSLIDTLEIHQNNQKPEHRTLSEEPQVIYHVDLKSVK